MNCERMNVSLNWPFKPPVTAGYVLFVKIGEFSKELTRRSPSNVWFSGGAVKPAKPRFVSADVS